MSKHQEILAYLEELPVGKRVSVRSISNRLGVSDGTAYRAIKEAENRGLVETRPRSGTVRVKSQKVAIERLTFAEIAEVTGSEVLAGQAGLDREFSKFSIGAMTEKNILSYLHDGGLLIVGDRTRIQLLALENENAVLVTGGFEVHEDVLESANKKNIPVLRSKHDTFTIATMINRALSNVQIKTDILNINEKLNELVEITAQVIEVEKLKSSKDHLRSLENKLNNFGDVNLLAINEFKQLKERYDYLARERDDVVKSRKQVMDLIQEIDERIHEDFHTTYQNINENFNKMCDETIRNTEGRLNIINPEDFENCGIEIFVKFKNKKKQPLSLLSGGEKSMVAIAFIMAIFMYKPSPFTFLDEIEAALDEKNTKNLLGKLRDFTDKSQFILITHNKETMKESDSIFGVTMNKEIGISKIVSPDKITKILSENKENN